MYIKNLALSLFLYFDYLKPYQKHMRYETTFTNGQKKIQDQTLKMIF